MARRFNVENPYKCGKELCSGSIPCQVLRHFRLILFLSYTVNKNMKILSNAAETHYYCEYNSIICSRLSLENNRNDIKLNLVPPGYCSMRATQRSTGTADWTRPLRPLQLAAFETVACSSQYMLDVNNSVSS
jgi:hypothetical protein